MTAKVLYFTAGPVATPEELADIAALNLAAEPAYTIGVRSGDVARVTTDYGENRPEPCDYVAGTVPDAYGEDGLDTPIIDPSDLPEPVDPDTQAVVTDGDTLPVTGGEVSLAVADGVLSGEFAPDGGHILLANGDELEEAGGGTIAVAIVDGVATYTYTPGA